MESKKIIISQDRKNPTRVCNQQTFLTFSDAVNGKKMSRRDDPPQELKTQAALQ